MSQTIVCIWFPLAGAALFARFAGRSIERVARAPAPRRSEAEEAVALAQ